MVKDGKNKQWMRKDRNVEKGKIDKQIKRKKQKRS